MKKSKNTFILGIICVIFGVLSFQIYTAYSSNKKDVNSYITAVSGLVQHNEIFIEQNQRIPLQVGDSVSVGEKSIGLIEWGDGSLTRLGENTKITIEQNSISKDYTKIQISFELLAGKTWSNIVSFLGKNSSFTQSFQGLEAGVRGTIFDVDLEADYLNVSSHLVTLTDNSGKQILVEEGKPIRISTLSLIEIQEFLKNIQDTAWTDLNTAYDRAYFETLTAMLEQSFLENPGILIILDFISPKYRILHALNTSEDYETIEKLLTEVPANQKSKVYTAVLSRYQDMNFIQAKDVVFYKRKVFYKRALLALTDDPIEQQQLLQRSSFDLKNALDMKATEQIIETMYVLLEHKDLLQQVNMSFVQESYSLLPATLLEDIEGKFPEFSSIFSETEILDISPDSIKNIKTKAEDSIKDFLDDTAGNMLKKMTQ